MVKCPRCKSANTKRELESVYEIDDTKYFDMLFICNDCLYTKPLTVERKSPIPKAKDAVTELAASLKLRPFMPKRKDDAPIIKERKIEGLPLGKVFNPLRHSKEIVLYGSAIMLGLVIEIAGLYFESYLRSVYIDPVVGFMISLMVFVFGPIIIAGGVVYYVTKDRLKAILFGSMAVPLTIILLAKLRSGTWGV
jgi:hypothetical protein